MERVGTLTLEVVKVEVHDDASVKKMWENVKEAFVTGEYNYRLRTSCRRRHAGNCRACAL